MPRERPPNRRRGRPVGTGGRLTLANHAPQNTPSPSTIRMRRYRERRDRGAVVISLEVHSDGLAALVEQRFLNEADVKSRAKVHEAVDLLLFALSDDAIEIDWEKYE